MEEGSPGTEMDVEQSSGEFDLMGMSGVLRKVPGETCLVKSFVFESTAKQKMEKEIDSCHG